MEKTKKESFFKDKDYHAFTALEKAHFLSFAPYAFQASVLLRDYGILTLLQQQNEGTPLSKLNEEANISPYGVRILVEAGIGIGLLYEENELYFITKTGMMFNTDKMVVINTNFMRDICYEGAGKLKESIETGRPAGLAFLGNWNTLYEGLSKLNPLQTKSWFEFDHYYSDFVFPQVMPAIFEYNPSKILDIGANTGKFSRQCLLHSKEIEMYLLDLPGQLALADTALTAEGFEGRYHLVPHNLLDNSITIPGMYDIIWMSQCLDCFADDEIVGILIKCKSALKEGGKVIINETFWDQQPFHASMYSLQMTSLYFSTIANGNSQMYDSRVFLQLVAKAGFKVEHIKHNVATTHTLVTLGL
ncbi:MAG: methyltransferase [Chitinophagaceae bacterium]|nr:methyltransferase [Chitinophagaceae bacterium]